jgi:hypothetical protein
MVAAILAVTAAPAPAKAWDDDFFGSYFQRSDKITLGAGDAQEVNEATHVIDPRPRNVRQRKIRTNGEKMVGAVNRCLRPPSNTSPGTTTTGTSTTTNSDGSSSTTNSRTTTRSQ